ncbi:MAG: hypothetical protein ACRC9U_02220 [Metamycoplasmataceae bacterium]
MNKKFLISLSSLSIIAPVLVITSCTSDTSNSNDLIITPKTAPRLTKEDITALEGSNLTAQLISLSKLFGGPGLIFANQINFKVAVNENQRIVTLIANQGFTINGKPLLESSKYEILSPGETIDLTITATPNVKLTDLEVAALNSSDANLRWAVLAKLFAGADFKAENLDSKFTIAVDTKNKKVTLTAKSGFTISSQQILSNTFTIDNSISPTDLNITVIANAKLTDNDVTALEGSNSDAKWAALEKLFGGTDFTSTNQSKFTVTFDKSKSTVTLTAVTGYTIGGNKSLSNTFTIDNSTAPTNLTITVIADAKLTEAEATALGGQDSTPKWAALKKLFSGSDFIPENEDKKFTISIDINNKKVTLTAKSGFVIAGTQSLSNTFVIDNSTAITELKITPRSGGAILLRPNDIVELGENNSRRLVVLQKLFEGADLVIGNVDKFTVEIPSEKFAIVLTAKPNYKFSGGTTIEKNYRLDQTINVNITVKTPLNPILSSTEVNKLKETPNSSNRDIQRIILSKAFNGLSDTNVRFFNIVVNENNRTITLYTKPGYIIGSSKFITASYLLS